MLTTEQFFEASRKAGFTRALSWKPSDGAPAQSADVIFRAPNRDALAGEFSVTDYTISYPATLLPGLKRLEEVVIEGAKYRVRENPQSELNGSRMRAPLTKI